MFCFTDFNIKTNFLKYKYRGLFLNNTTISQPQDYYQKCKIYVFMLARFARKYIISFKNTKFYLKDRGLLIS